MQYKNIILITIIILLGVYFITTSVFASATTTPGSVVPTQNYRGAPFTWERWLKPIMYIWVEAGKTMVCVFNPNYSEVNTCDK